MTNTHNAPLRHDDMLGARHAALLVLHDVATMRQPLDVALEKIQLARLPIRDRAFVRMLAATALRRLGQIDAAIAHATERADAPNPPILHNLLRLGAAQALFMNVPDYAVVDTSVRLADMNGLARQRGLVNAVLRRIAREATHILRTQDEAALNIPPWLLAIWDKDYGTDTARLIVAASVSEAPLDISVKTQTERAYWAEQLQAPPFPTGTLRRKSGGMVSDLPGFDEGAWWVQDASAALPARLMGDVNGQNVLDLCAAPGGKTMQLAAMGAQVHALDRSANRMKILRENATRLRLESNITTEIADAAAWMPREKVPLILLDAPCTATGTARRNPDVFHLKKPADLATLEQVQARMLAHATTMLAPGGILIYCTCSLQKSEGEAQIDALLENGAPLRRLPVTPDEIGGLDNLITPQGDVRILPYHMAALGGMDGFYIARLTKA